MQQQMTIYDWLAPDHGSQSGKTYQEPLVRQEKECQKAQTSKPSSRSSSASLSQTLPMCLFLKTDGVNQESSWESIDPGASLIESTTPSSGEFRREGGALLSLWTLVGMLPLGLCLELNSGEQPNQPNPTKLSQILEEADPKYNLSAKACSGILSRAARRGKALPEILRQALENQIQRSNSEG